MWFKQIQFFHIQTKLVLDAETLSTALKQLLFSPCLPLLPQGFGWVPPQEEDEAPLVFEYEQYRMICLKIEEKVLPANVVNQHLADKIKEVETEQERRVSQKEKRFLKDEIITSLMPKAFSKLKALHAYIDTQTNMLLINTVNKKETDIFLDAWKKVLPQCKLIRPTLKRPATVLTHWLLHNKQPQVFAIEKACVLHDPQQKNRIIRFQHQNLQSQAVQLLLKDGCEVNQLALLWQDQLSFTLSDECSIRGIKMDKDIVDELIDDFETKQQRFASDFVIMTKTLSKLLNDLLTVFEKSETNKIEKDALAVMD